MTYSLLRVAVLCGCNSISCNLMAIGTNLHDPWPMVGHVHYRPTKWQLPMNRRRWLALSLHAWDQGWNLSKQGANLEDFVEISVFADIMWSQKGPKRYIIWKIPKNVSQLFPQLVKYSNVTRCNHTEFPVAMAEEACQGVTPSSVWKWLKLCSTFLGTLPFPDGFSHHDFVFHKIFFWGGMVAC